MSEIWDWSATETAARVAARDVSAKEVTEAALARIDMVEPVLNALSERTPDIARAAAEAVDAALAAGQPLGALAGVPITIKDNTDQAGTRNTSGILAAKDNWCREDSPLVANLTRAGAIPIGRSTVPAFSFRWFTDTDLHGRTYNPHGRDLSPGGSSGGAAVAVATGMGALAHGNDIGGSIRFPALVNGVAGLRPTVGRVPSYNASGNGARIISSQMITSDGPIARNVADLRLGLNAMAAQDARDPQHVPMPPVGEGMLPAKIGLVRGSTLGTPAPEVDAAMTRAATALEAAGCEIVETTLPRFEEAFDVWYGLVMHAVYHHYGAAISNSGDRALVHNIDMVRDIVPDISGGKALDLWAERLQIMRDWSLMFEDLPVVLTPVSYRHGLRVGADQGDQAGLEQLFRDQAPLIATALIGHPGLSVPTGLATDGVPTGVQLSARWWDESSLLAAGEVIERAMPPVLPILPKG